MHGDPELVRWIPWGPRTREEAAAVLERKIACRTIEAEGDGLGIAVVLKETGEMIGDFSLQYVSEEHSVAELGLPADGRDPGAGLRDRGSRAILRLAFEDLGFHRVIARLEARNDASAALAERLGMRREAEFVENEWIKGEWQSEIVYAMLAREWTGTGPGLRE